MKKLVGRFAKACEGDLIETFEGVIFDVKGFTHPSGRIIAYIRFIPDSKGNRRRDGLTYRKVYALHERYAILRSRFPRYLVYDEVFDEELCEVPIKEVKCHYKPVERLRGLRVSKDLDEIEAKALQFIKMLKEEANVSWNKLGISGSILVRLHKQNSDIDPIVYGSENCRRVHLALSNLMSEGNLVKSYSREELKQLFNFRNTKISFEDFIRTESRKVFQGKFMQHDFFVRFVKDWEEMEGVEYGATRYKALGYARIKAVVTDDSEAIFTPCNYKINCVELLEGVNVGPIKEISSFRGRFCEQARVGEVIIAQGKVELVHKENEDEYYRLLLGNKPSDYMILKN